ncbi:40-kDa huntingtin-associated protein isoform X5 [Anthonomus grandis grandis]|nr:40-kDa huntingtin-associated protein isoform X5 [Anthonomus grandis grandis]
MTESTGFELLDQYRSITSKLKKRFLRKPNETEASESFAALGQQCESQELPQYAALSWLAAARCEGTLGNPVSETAYLLRAARQFFKAEQEDFLTGCTCVSTENLEAGISCYHHASQR